jgi:lipopolysaccharide export system protein LptA
MSKNNYLALVLPFLFICWNSPALALKTDKDQPIEITADRAERDEKLGITIYHGHVEIHQGSMLIEAEHVVIKTPVTHDTTQELEEITTNGKPSHFRQQINEEGDVVDASAMTIHYRVNDKKVDLVNGATLKQEGRVLTGENISYDIGSQRVTANSGEVSDNPDARSTSRVTVIIPAKTHKSENANTNPAPSPAKPPSP